MQISSGIVSVENIVRYGTNSSIVVYLPTPAIIGSRLTLVNVTTSGGYDFNVSTNRGIYTVYQGLGLAPSTNSYTFSYISNGSGFSWYKIAG